jgi:hypothetical protein
MRKREKEMESLTIRVVVGADRRLVIDLPASTPLGPAEVVVRPYPDGSGESERSARERARAKLLAAGFLTTDIHAPQGAIPLSSEEIAQLGRLPSGARPSEDLIDEDRGSY